MSQRQGLLRASVSAAGLLLSFASSATRAQDPLENAPLAPQSAKEYERDAGKSDSTSTSDATAARPKPKPEFIKKTPAEWRGILSRVQYAVTREKATEPPYTGRYSSGHFKGTFVCVCCDAAHVQSELFSSQTKFESGTGWPSFYQAFNARAVQTAWDFGGLEQRLEVMCRRCGAHLGHVFDDGPPPTGLRFCINSAAIKLVSPEAEAAPKNAANKGTAKSKVKPKAGAKAAPVENKPEKSATSDAAATNDKAKGDSSTSSP